MIPASRSDNITLLSLQTHGLNCIFLNSKVSAHSLADMLTLVLPHHISLVDIHYRLIVMTHVKMQRHRCSITVPITAQIGSLTNCHLVLTSPIVLIALLGANKVDKFAA